MTFEFGSLIVASVVVGGAVIAGVKLIIRGELAAFLKDLDGRYELSGLARERHAELDRRITHLERAIR